MKQFLIIVFVILLNACSTPSEKVTMKQIDIQEEAGNLYYDQWKWDFEVTYNE